MCGIAGIITKTAAFRGDNLGSLARGMADRMVHRGPDDSGIWISADGKAALAHRRLSILDTSPAGHQPMANARGDGRISFNGEIYNFMELRRKLEAEGVRFHSRSDTEVLLAWVDHFGADAIGEVDGMFAFAFYHESEGSLLLARDRFGEKPLYYAETVDWFAFASELSALACLPGFDHTIDADAIAAYLAYQYVPAPGTIYRSARKLLPGHVLIRKASGAVQQQDYFRFVAGSAPAAPRSLAEAADQLEDILARSVAARLVSDVPIGAFLSGGVDSATVVALACKTKPELSTFTVGFAGHRESEHAYAAEISAHLGTDHQEQLLTPDALGLCREIGALLDEPNGDTSCLPTLLLSRFTRARATVALSGDGGDEMFGGYNRYFATIEESARAQGNPAIARWSPGATYWSSRILVFPESELALLAGEPPASLINRLAVERAALDSDSRPLIHRLREADAREYMPGAVLAKVDRMSMQASLEVRAPLLGREVADFAAGLSASECFAEGSGKRVLKEVASRHLPVDWMNRPKQGFGLPADLWGAGTLLPAARQALCAKDTRLASWIAPTRLAAYLDHMARDFSPYRVWSLLVLEHWLRTHPASVGSRFAVPSWRSRASGLAYRLRRRASGLLAGLEG
jgi:asparagine synthase (glutamine-hydrolysing)